MLEHCTELYLALSRRSRSFSALLRSVKLATWTTQPCVFVASFGADDLSLLAAGAACSLAEVLTSFAKSAVAFGKAGVSLSTNCRVCAGGTGAGGGGGTVCSESCANSFGCFGILLPVMPVLLTSRLRIMGMKITPRATRTIAPTIRCLRWVLSTYVKLSSVSAKLAIIGRLGRSGPLCRKTRKQPRYHR